MRKYALTFAVLFLAVLVAGCGSPPGQEGTPTLAKTEAAVQAADHVATPTLAVAVSTPTAILPPAAPTVLAVATVAATARLTDTAVPVARATANPTPTAVAKSAASPTATATVATVGPSSTVAVIPTAAPTDTATPEATPSQALLARGVEVYRAQFCGTCHQLTAAGTGGLFGPTHDGIGAAAQQRIQAPGYSGSATTPAEYLRESIVRPQAYLVPGYESSSHSMPAFTFLSEEEIEALVQMLLQQQ